jgi:hypothetical protein
MANGKILLDLIEKLGTNVSAFEKSIKVSPTRIDKLIKRDSKISLEIVQLITEAFPQVNRQWLLSGEGEMFVLKSSMELEAGSISKKNMDKSVELTNQHETADCEKVKMENEFLKQRVRDLEEKIEDKKRIIALLEGDNRSKHSA